MRLFNETKSLILFDQIIFSGTSFLMTILIARHLPASDFGLYSSYILFNYLAVSAISSWTTQVFQVSSERSSTYISFVFWIQIILTVLLGSICLIVNYLLKIYFSVFAIIFGMGFTLYDFGRKVSLAQNKIATTIFLDFLTSTLMIISFLIFKFLDFHGIDQMLVSFVIVYIISIFIIIIILQPFNINSIEYQSFAKKHLMEGKWLFFTSISQWWAGNLFVVASGLYLGSAALGALRLGQSIFGLLNILLQTFENYVLPQAAHKMNQSHQSGLKYLKELNQKLSIFFIPVLMFTFLFAEQIITIAGGNNYKDYAFVLKGLSILYVFILLSQPIRFVFRALAMNNHFFYAYFISLIFALSSSNSLISNFGLHGVIAGLIGTQIILLGYWVIVLHSKNIRLWKSSTSF